MFKKNMYKYTKDSFLELCIFAESGQSEGKAVIG
jgi:hypothetical protein